VKWDVKLRIDWEKEEILVVLGGLQKAQLFPGRAVVICESGEGEQR
jgi:hypothetical protein